MPKYFRRFTAIIVACLGLTFCFMLVSPFIAIFNEGVGLIFLYITIGLMISTMLIYLIFCFISLVKLLMEDWD